MPRAPVCSAPVAAHQSSTSGGSCAASCSAADEQRRDARRVVRARGRPRRTPSAAPRARASASSAPTTARAASATSARPRRAPTAAATSAAASSSARGQRGETARRAIARCARPRRAPRAGPRTSALAGAASSGAVSTTRRRGCVDPDPRHDVLRVARGEHAREPRRAARGLAPERERRGAREQRAPAAPPIAQPSAASRKCTAHTQPGRGRDGTERELDLLEAELAQPRLHAPRRLALLVGAREAPRQLGRAGGSSGTRGSRARGSSRDEPARPRDAIPPQRYRTSRGGSQLGVTTKGRSGLLTRRAG